MTPKRHFATMSLLAALAFAPAVAEDQVKGWWTKDGTYQDYDFGTEHVDGGQGQKSAFIKCIVPAPKNFGGMSQGVNPMPYRGKRVRLSAMLKTKDADGAALWLRMDGSDNKALNFSNMNDRMVKGTTGWKRYDIVLDVPPETLRVVYGYFVLGKGEAWADSFKLETVGKDVPVSATGVESLPDKPVNANFEE